jgi:hypothetical protein
MPSTLRIISGSRDSAHDELHVELAVARAERTIFTAKVRVLVRTALRYLAAGFPAAAGTALLGLDRLNEQEARRVAAMTAPCPCGLTGAGHGPADEDALAA